MDRVRRGAILLQLISKMKDNGSWCGETHLQKAIYIAETLGGLETGYEFILYKHGPFSFDLRDELTALRADEVLFLQPRGSYGPTYETTDGASNWVERYPKTLAKYKQALDFATESIGSKGVKELERLTTALYVLTGPRAKQEMLSQDRAAARITELKPHIQHREAARAVEQAEELRVRAGALKVAGL